MTNISGEVAVLQIAYYRFTTLVIHQRQPLK